MFVIPKDTQRVNCLIASIQCHTKLPGNLLGQSCGPLQSQTRRAIRSRGFPFQNNLVRGFIHKQKSAYINFRHFGWPPCRTP